MIKTTWRSISTNHIDDMKWARLSSTHFISSIFSCLLLRPSCLFRSPTECDYHSAKRCRAARCLEMKNCTECGKHLRFACPHGTRRHHVHGYSSPSACTFVSAMPLWNIRQVFLTTHLSHFAFMLNFTNVMRWVAGRMKNLCIKNRNLLWASHFGLHFDRVVSRMAWTRRQSKRVCNHHQIINSIIRCKWHNFQRIQFYCCQT